MAIVPNLHEIIETTLINRGIPYNSFEIKGDCEVFIDGKLHHSISNALTSLSRLTSQQCKNTSQGKRKNKRKNKMSLV